MEKVQNVSEVISNIQKLANQHNSAQVGLIKLDRLAYKTESYDNLSSWLKDALDNEGVEKKSDAVRNIGQIMGTNIDANDSESSAHVRMWQKRLNYLLSFPQSTLFVGYSLEAPNLYTKVSLKVMNQIFDDIKANF